METMSPSTQELMKAEALRCGYKDVDVTEFRIQTTKATMESRVKNRPPSRRKRRFFAFHTRRVYVITDNNNEEIVVES